MNPELLYILKVNIAIGVFFLFYWLLLRKNTFYQWKRYYFLAALPLSFLFPLIDFSGFFTPVQVQTIQQITPHFPINMSGGVEKGFSIQDGMLFAILIGSAILFIRLTIQLISLRKVHNESNLEKDYRNYNIRKMNTVTNPFSFFQTIYINPKLHDSDDMKAILNHEQIHVSQWHSIDIILLELVCAFCWYNPLAWLLRQAVRQNIEFYTDKQILEIGYNKRQYQQELLKVSQIPNFLEIATNFNFNHLKKRIIMMNKKNSNKMQLLKFAFIVPLFAGMAVFANSNVSLTNLASSNVSMTNQELETTVDTPIAETTVVADNNATPSRQDAKKVTVEKAAPVEKKVVVNETVHDFGTIQEKDGKATAVFTFTNNTDKPIVISNVKPSCGCTTPEWTKEPIAPSKQGQVKAIYDAAGRPGPFDKSIAVETTGDPTSFSLRIKGTVVVE